MSIYFIAAYTDKWQRVKIGRAGNVQERLADLQIGAPMPLKLLGEFKTHSRSHEISLEGWLHRHFAGFWVTGEWFQLTAPLREFIAAVCSGDQEAAKAALAWAEKSLAKRRRNRYCRLAQARRKMGPSTRRESSLEVRY